ncbi:MAG: ABC transporter substrate-binding protein [Steroidobacteraceae bacterium]
MRTLAMYRFSAHATFAAAALGALLLFAGPIARGQNGATPARQVDTSGPSQLIESAANIMLGEISARRAEFRKDPSGLYKLVDDVLLPHFDVNHAARLVLGRHWSSATPEQRQRFVDAFYRSMLNNYGDALVEFTGDRIRVLPYKGDPAAKSASVRTTVRRSNGQVVPVNYSLRLTEQGWKAWDVVIEGISYVKSFREDFGAEIDQKGIEAVIERLEAQRSAKQAA